MDLVNTGLLTEIFSTAAEHLQLVGESVGAALLIGIPAGVLAARVSSVRAPALGVVNILQTIPSLALFGFLIPFVGIGPQAAVVALIAYAMLPIVRNTLTGILGVDPAIRESAVAMGMTPRQILLWVELPLAAPTLMAGVRVATVTTVGTATIAAAIGGGGLGTFIFRGVATVDTTLLLAGAIPAALIALAADGGLGWFEKRLSASL